MTFDVDDLVARLPEVLAEVAARREVVLARGAVPLAKIDRWKAPPLKDADAALVDLRANRENYRPVTFDEIVAWKNEGKR